MFINDTIFKIKHNKLLLNLLIIFSFILLAIINASLIFMTHKLNLADDIQFHWNEALEILKSHVIFPRFALNSFSFSGSAVLTMYPYLFLMPWVLLFRVVHSVILVTDIMFVVNTFIGLMVAYYCSLRVSHNVVISYIFSIMYSISTYLCYTTFITYDMGMEYTFIFIPIVIFGFIYWLKTDKWMMLSIGMTLLIFSSVILSAFVPFILLLWLLYNYKFINKIRLINLFKAAILSLLVSAIFWLPALKILLFNKLMYMGWNMIQGANPIKALMSTFIPSLLSTDKSSGFLMTIYAALGVIIGIIRFKKLRPLLKQFLIISIIIMFFSSDIFPWMLLRHTYLNTIQMPWRLYVIPQVLLIYILATYMYVLTYKLHFNYFSIILIIICFICGFQLINEQGIIRSFNESKSFNNIVFDTKTNNSDYYPKILSRYPLNFNKVNNNPKRYRRYFYNIQGHKGYIYGHSNVKEINIYPSGNGEFHFKNNKSIKKLALPFIKYNGIKYKCLIDNKPISTYTNRKQLMTIINLPKGSHEVHINVLSDKNIIISRILTIVGLISYAFIMYKHKLYL